MNRSKPIVAAAIAAALAWTIPTSAATRTASTSDAPQDARAILARGLDAMGGLDNLRAAGTLTVKAQVEEYDIGQSVRAGIEDPPRRSRTLAWTRDPDGQWWIREQLAGPEGQPVLREVWTPEDQFMHIIVRNQIMDLPWPAFWESIDMSMTDARALMLDAQDHADALKLLETRGDASSERAIAYQDEAGRPMSLFFDAETGVLVRWESTRTLLPFGDTLHRAVFGDYRAAGSMVLPHSIRTTRGPYRVATVQVAGITPGVEFDPSLLERPKDAALAPGGPPTGPAGETRVEQLAPDVYQILNVTPEYNVMFVVQGDEAIVIEAPGGPKKSREVIERIRSVAPRARVTGFVLTHHHFDHSAGLWTYIAEGNRIYATPGNEDFVRQVASSPRKISGETRMATPIIDPVDSRRMVGTGPGRFELINVGPNPHAEEILVAYFPEHKLMWVPDVYGYVPGYTPPPLLQSFARKLAELDLDIQRFATAHTEVSDIEDFNEMVKQTAAAGP